MLFTQFLRTDGRMMGTKEAQELRTVEIAKVFL